MISRVLPPEEWPRLAGTEAESVWQNFNPDVTRVVVVEEEGEIVGCWCMLRVMHAECLWIRPDRRGSFGVAKGLLKGMRDAAKEWGVTVAVTASASEHVTELIRRFGGMPLMYDSFVLPAVSGSHYVAEEETCRQHSRNL